MWRWTIRLASAALMIACESPSGIKQALASTCAEAARSAEDRNGLPAGLLMAISNVESGGRSWSVDGNDGSSGHRFASAQDALRYTEALISQGTRSLDLGCFQVNILYHPTAFRRWQDAFDDDANANAAAAILNALHTQTGDWSRAVALYHSADAERGTPYLRAVLNAWSGNLTLPDETFGESALRIGARGVAVPVLVWGPNTILTGEDGIHRGYRGKLPSIITP